jgi:glycosyltransferase involved in cell wall biosynthesis
VFFYYELDMGIPTRREGKSDELSNGFAKIKDKIIGLFRNDPIYNLRSGFRRDLIKNKIQLVLAEYGPTATGIIPILKKLHLPLIVHLHGYDAYKYEVLEKYKSGYQDFFSYAKYIIAVSEDMRIQLINLGAPQDKLILNPYDPDPDYEKVIPNFNEESFLFYGRFVDKKAPYYLILALQIVIQKYPNVKLYMGGDGPLLNTCKNLSKHYNLEDHIIFSGVLKKERIIELYEKCLAFVQHSITPIDGDKEGTPVAILEALSVGVPVISTSHGGIKDIINQSNGFLVNEHDVKMMAKHMISIIENKDSWIADCINRKKSEHQKKDRHMNTLNNIINSSLEI